MLIKVLFGFLGGILGGMGMGGGTLLIPLLTVFLSFSQNHAQSINLIAFLPISIVTLIIHTKNKLVCYKEALPIVISGVISAVIGALIMGKLEGDLLKKLFGYFLLAIAVYQIVLLFKKTKKSEKKYNNGNVTTLCKE